MHYARRSIPKKKRTWWEKNQSTLAMSLISGGIGLMPWWATFNDPWQHWNWYSISIGLAIGLLVGIGFRGTSKVD